MAASFMKKTMAYLGLVDDDYDDYDDYESRAPLGRVATRQQVADDVDDYAPAPSNRIRTLPREPAVSTATPSGNGMPTISSRQPSTPSIRPMPSPDPGTAKVHIVAPARFADAQEIANRFMDNQPVIVNMQSAERDLQRRMIDFCSGVTYALSGGMERVADEVFLLTPSNVKVSDEERQRLADRGLVNP
jgi:cell division inhibitor SepF